MSDAANNRETANPIPPQLAAHCFQPGQSGNPSGRPKKQPLTKLYEELLDEGVTIDAIRRSARAIIKQKSNVTIQLLKEMADRVEGETTKRVEHTGADGEALSLVIKLVTPAGVKEIR